MPRKHGLSSGVQKLIVSPVESLQIRDDLQVRQEDLLEDSNIALNKHKRGSCQDSETLQSRAQRAFVFYLSRNLDAI